MRLSPAVAFIAEAPLGVQIGQDCLHFPNRTFCFLTELPHTVIPASISIYPNREVSHASSIVYPWRQQQQEQQQQCQHQAPWHLPRISQSRMTNGDYPFDSVDDGHGVDIYVLDTWVDVEHQLLSGRAERLQAFYDHDPTTDPVHGTHCSGLAGGDYYGVARAAQLYSVQVLDDKGQGDFDIIIRGLHYAWQHAQQRQRPSIVSCSISGGRVDAVNHAFEDLMNTDHLFIVVAAGNDNHDASENSPASADVVVVGATTAQDLRASFSNFGQPVKLFAPGDTITSLCTKNRLCVMSGTSMATPIVAGIAAVEWAKQSHLTPRELWQFMGNKRAVRNVLRNIPHGTVNKLVQLPRQCLLMFQQPTDSMILQPMEYLGDGGLEWLEDL